MVLQSLKDQSLRRKYILLWPFRPVSALTNPSYYYYTWENPHSQSILFRYDSGHFIFPSLVLVSSSSYHSIDHSLNVETYQLYLHHLSLSIKQCFCRLLLLLARREKISKCIEWLGCHGNQIFPTMEAVMMSVMPRLHYLWQKECETNRDNRSRGTSVVSECFFVCLCVCVYVCVWQVTRSHETPNDVHEGVNGHVIKSVQ